MEFFDSMEPLLRLFWYVALPVSLIFVIQSIMTFVGLDGHDSSGTDVHHDTSSVEDGIQILTVRNLINFLLGFSWSGISFYNVIGSKFLLISVAVIIGILFVALFIYLLLQIQKLSEDNSFKIEKTLHQTGSVYLPIPAHKSGKGIVQISVNGSVHELNAITTQDRIETGAMIRVVKIEATDLVLVEKI